MNKGVSSCSGIFWRSIRGRPARAPFCSGAMAVSVDTRSSRFGSIIRSPGWVEHDPNEIWESERAVAAQALRESGLAARSRRSASRTSARRRFFGIARRAIPSTTPSSAVPPHGGHRGCPSRKARRERACGRENGIAHRRLLFRDEDQVAARPRPQRAGKGRARRNFIRYGGDMAHLEADGRQGPRDGLLERQPHDALQHPHAFVG